MKIQKFRYTHTQRNSIYLKKKIASWWHFRLSTKYMVFHYGIYVWSALHVLYRDEQVNVMVKITLLELQPSN